MVGDTVLAVAALGVLLTAGAVLSSAPMSRATRRRHRDPSDPDTTVPHRQRESRESGGSLPLSDQPWYVRALVWVGAPCGAMAYLLWFLVSATTAKFDASNAAILEVNKSIAGMQAQLGNLVTHLQQENDRSKTQADQLWVQLGVMQRICLNTSKTDADRIACATIVPTRQSQ